LRMLHCLNALVFASFKNRIKEAYKINTYFPFQFPAFI